jgi:hypothetical protein
VWNRDGDADMSIFGATVDKLFYEQSNIPLMLKDM